MERFNKNNFKIRIAAILMITHKKPAQSKLRLSYTQNANCIVAGVITIIKNMIYLFCKIKTIQKIKINAGTTTAT